MYYLSCRFGLRYNLYSTPMLLLLLLLNCKLYVYFNNTVTFKVACFRCVAVTLSDANCKSEWVPLEPRYTVDGSKQHSPASTLTECQNACEFDPQCVAVDWESQTRDCWLNTNPNHKHSIRYFGTHYDLVSRCNITSGQCFDLLRMT